MLQPEFDTAIPEFEVLLTASISFLQRISLDIVKLEFGGVLIRIGETVATDSPQGFIAFIVTPNVLL